MKKKELLKGFVTRYFIDGFSGMALGLFATLIVGLILKQIGNLVNIDAIVWMGTMATVMTGVGIGVGVAIKFKASPLVIYSSAVTGFIGAYAAKIISGAAFSNGTVVLIGPGEPLGAFIAAVVGIEIGRLVVGKTKLDIIITPMVTILTGGTIGLLIGPAISSFMTFIGEVIILATEQAPIIMGSLVSMIMGIMLTLPISSAALSIILGLSGLAAGAATVGCASNMVGFAVSSYRENKVSGLVAQGLGTSMLQVPNIVKNPRIWIPPILTSAILGPIATVVFKMENNASGGGMGTSGLVGQLMTWDTMIAGSEPVVLLIKIILMHFIFPAILALFFSEVMRKKGWIKFGDMKLDV
ncbi:MAG: PTS sugar transporter subunit IIC [Vallitaleaceae bacterium]|jgi:uncharacterized membrane protein|nr:PTS sugar transporter subunit IIC [Vallitaleaceae bacterium]